jgi:hypothetical protein
VRGDVGRGWSLGRGLAEGSDDLHGFWTRLVDTVSSVSTSERNFQVLRGFLAGVHEREPDLSSQLLDDAVLHPVVGPWFPALQTSIPIDTAGAKRLETSVASGLVTPWMFQHLALGRATDPIPSNSLGRIVMAVASVPNGFWVAVDILGMRLHSARSDGAPADPALFAHGRRLLRACTFEQPQHSGDYHLANIVDDCLIGDAAADDAAFICQRFKTAMLDHRTAAYAYEAFAAAIFRAQPRVALNEFLGDQVESVARAVSRFFDSERNPIDQASQDAVIAWAQENPSVRFPRAAWAINPFHDPDGPNASWSPLAVRMVDLAPDPVAVLAAFVNRFQPNSWSGSLATIIDNRRRLLVEFLSHSDPRIAEWARSTDSTLRQRIEAERSSERKDDATFE